MPYSEHPRWQHQEYGWIEAPVPPKNWAGYQLFREDQHLYIGYFGHCVAGVIYPAMTLEEADRMRNALSTPEKYAVLPTLNSQYIMDFRGDVWDVNSHVWVFRNNVRAHLAQESDEYQLDLSVEKIPTSVLA